MFNDYFKLNQAVVEGIKTNTRRITCDDLVTLNTGDKVMPDEIFLKDDVWYYRFKNGYISKMIKSHLPGYKVGEIVAIAQSYKNAGIEYVTNKDGSLCHASTTAGWNNKMFVRADLMPRQICITNLRAERLQDISDEDCLKEGVVVDEPKIAGAVKSYYPCKYLQSCANEVGFGRVFNTPREAFAYLINKVSKKGTWESNPFVWVYDFELVK